MNKKNESSLVSPGGDSPFHDTIIRINHYIATHHLLPPQSRIVVGFSGGPDSLFLLHLLASLRTSHQIELIAAHLDHGWRLESAQEAVWCADVAAQLQIPFVTKKLTTLSATLINTGSREDYARRARRHFLELVRGEHNADRIALAHHAQDQEETFFIRLIRGATATGLGSMRPHHGSYIRPLLHTNKNDILAYLTAHKLTYLTDPTNTSCDFLRNRLRHLVLPELDACDNRFQANFKRTIQHLQNTEDFLDRLTNTLITQVTETRDDKLMLNIALFNAQDPFMQYRILMHLLIQTKAPFTPSQNFLDEIIRFLKHPRGGTHSMHTHWHIVKKKSWAYISKS